MSVLSFPTFAQVPAGVSVIGAGQQARFVDLPEFRIAETAFSNALWREYRRATEHVPLGVFLIWPNGREELLCREPLALRGGNLATDLERGVSLFWGLRELWKEGVSERDVQELRLILKDYVEEQAGTGLILEIIKRLREKKGSEELLKNLHSEKVVPPPGEWEVEKDKDLQERFGRENQQPVVCVTQWEAESASQWLVEEMVKAGELPKGVVGRLPTDEEWEKAARGPAVDVVKVMKEERISNRNFVTEFRDRCDHFVIGGKIVTAEEVEGRLRSAQGTLGTLWNRLLGKQTDQVIVSAFLMHSTPSGSLSEEEVWYNQNWETGRTQDVHWGPKAGYGTKQMTGNVWERTTRNSKEKYPYGQRGGSWDFDLPEYLRASCRDYYGPDNRCYDFGFRVGASVPQDF